MQRIKSLIIFEECPLNPGISCVKKNLNHCLYPPTLLTLRGEPNSGPDAMHLNKTRATEMVP